MTDHAAGLEQPAILSKASAPIAPLTEQRAVSRRVRFAARGMQLPLPARQLSGERGRGMGLVQNGHPHGCRAILMIILKPCSVIMCTLTQLASLDFACAAFRQLT